MAYFETNIDINIRNWLFRYQYRNRYHIMNHFNIDIDINNEIFLFWAIFRNDIDIETDNLLHSLLINAAKNKPKFQIFKFRYQYRYQYPFHSHFEINIDINICSMAISKPISISISFPRLFRNQYRFNIDIFGKFRYQNQ